MASKLSRFGVCKLGYLVIQTDLPILDNKEKDCESPLLFLLLSRFGFGKKKHNWQVNYPDLVFVNQDI